MEQKNQSKLHSGGLLVFILTVGVFGIINTEMGVVGILPLIAETFDVSVPQAGWTVSIFALVVAASAPVTPLLFLGVNRKKVMLLALGLFTLSNIISMLTTNFTVLLVARILPAFLHPVYVSMAFTVAAASVSKEKAPKAVSRVFVGVSAGMVLGVPVTSFIASEVSFLISSPMVDLGSLVLLMSIFGAKVAILYVVLGLVIAVAGGTLIEKQDIFGIEIAVRQSLDDSSSFGRIVKFFRGLFGLRFWLWSKLPGRLFRRGNGLLFGLGTFRGYALCRLFLHRVLIRFHLVDC